MLNRVVVTGIGVISPLGVGVDENWRRLIAGQSGIDYIKKFETESFPIKIAGEVPSNYRDYLEGKDARYLDPFIQYALIATQQALDDSGLVNHKNVGVVIGSGQGGISNIEREHPKRLDIAVDERVVGHQKIQHGGHEDHVLRINQPTVEPPRRLDG